MLSHKNFIAQILSSRVTLADLVITPKDVHISYLPLAHVFERVVSNILLAAGGTIGFYFSFLSLFNDIAVCEFFSSF
jgi:long-chain acyl-CoA synthetase